MSIVRGQTTDPAALQTESNQMSSTKNPSPTSIENALDRIQLLRSQRDAINAELSELVDYLSYHYGNIGTVISVLSKEGIKTTTHAWV